MSSNTIALEMWAKVFDISESDLHVKAAMVAANLTMLDLELDSLCAQLSASGFPEDMYGPRLKGVRGALSTHSLSQNWNVAKGHMTPDVIHCLEWCSEILEDREELLDEKELEELQSQLSELRSSINDSTLPSAVVAVLKRHMELLENAFSSYGIRGATAFKEAVHQGAGDIIEYGDVLAEHSNEKEVTILGKVWGLALKAGDKIQWADKTGQSAGRLKDLFEKAIESLSSS